MFSRKIGEFGQLFKKGIPIKIGEHPAFEIKKSPCNIYSGIRKKEEEREKREEKK